MRDILTDYDRFQAAGERIGRAVVTSVWGSAPRPEGACLVATATGLLAGSVSGGCVEAAVAEEIRSAIAQGSSRVVSFGVSHETAWSVGLACGGTISVLVEGTVREEVLEAARGPGGSVVVTRLDGPMAGAILVFHEEDPALETGPDLLGLPRTVMDAARDALRRGASQTIELPLPSGDPARVFLEVYPRQPTLIIIGGVHIAAELVPLARRLGYRTVVADARAGLLTRERFPDADELIQAWPEEVFVRVGIGAATYICVLSHDPKFDEPACRIALRSPARYIGAIGSRKTQASRRARLASEGFSEEEIARLRGPIGLDLGGRSAAEIALAIMAEMTRERYGAG